MRVAVIGAGITGLIAAYRLSQKGHQVVVFEKEKYAGGQAAGFERKNWRWPLDNFFHHLFVSDEEVKRLVAELNLSDKLFYLRPKTSIFYRNKISQFDSPFSVLAFPHLSFPEKLRTGLVTAYLKLKTLKTPRMVVRLKNTSEASAVSSAESVAAAVKRGWDVRRPGWTPRRCNFVKLQEIYQKGFDILFLLGIVGVIFVWLFAPLMVRFLTQQRFTEFSDSAAVLRILVVAMFVAYFNHLSGYTIVALGKQRPYFFIALGSLVFNIAANLVIIPRFSYFGAAWVTVLTEGLVLSITTIFIFRLLGVVPSMVNFPKTAVQLLRKKGKIF